MSAIKDLRHYLVQADHFIDREMKWASDEVGYYTAE